MPSCCFFICCRPRTYQRLLQDVYRASAADRKKADLVGNKSKIDVLVDYAGVYPQKLRLIMDSLDHMFLRSIARGEHGYVVLSIELFRLLLAKYHQLQLVYMLEAHLSFIIRSAIQSYDAAYMQAAAKLLKDCIRCDAFSALDFIDAILDLCEDPAVVAQSHTLTRFMGFTVLTALIKLLHRRPAYLCSNLQRIVSIIFTVLEDTANKSQLTPDMYADEVARCAGSALPLSNNNLGEIGWKAWQALCSTSSNTLQAIIRLVCESIVSHKVPFCTVFVHQLFFVLASSAQPQGISVHALLPTLLLEHIAGQMGGGMVKSIVRDGVEVRDRLGKVSKLEDSLQFVLLWTTGNPQELAVDEMLARMGHVLDITCQFIKLVPSLVHCDVFAHSEALISDAAISNVLDLPSMLLPVQHAKEMDQAAGRVMGMLQLLVEQLAQSARIGANFRVMLEALVRLTKNASFSGDIAENVLFQHYHTVACHLLQVLLSNVHVDHLAMTICQPALPALLSDAIMQGLLIKSTNFELMRHSVLTIMVVLRISQPLSEHFVLTHPDGLPVQEAWKTAPFYPHAPAVMQGLLGYAKDIIFMLAAASDRMEASRHVCVLCQLLGMLIANHGSQTTLVMLPMLMALEATWKELSPAGASYLQMLFVGCLLSMAQRLQCAELVAWTMACHASWAASRTAEHIAYDRLTLDSNGLRLVTLVDEVPALGVGGAVAAVDKAELLQVLLSCQTFQALTNQLHMAMSMSFTSHQADSMLDCTDITLAMDEGSAVAQPLNRMLFDDLSQLTPPSPSSPPSPSGQSRRLPRKASRMNRSSAAMEDDRYSKAAIKSGYSVQQEPIELLGIRNKETCNAVPRHIRTEHWKREYRDLIQHYQDSNASTTELLDDVLSVL